MTSLFVSFAGYQGPKSPVHKALAEMRTGSPVRLVARGNKVAIVGSNDVAVALLSMPVEVEWRALLGQVVDAHVMAIVEKRRDQAEPEYQAKLVVDSWELPIIEVRYRLGEVRAR